ncbi:hypothetical protein TWF569_005917 [Orbilia oligospora]|uniref:CENP-V/GFA domain-containing protein n=1 Tax=Orbilia oligospora TaxID=2813651 RepID=A0A7C8KB80_ORBOL|nr:hypothetical protein TWF102_011338 [Orbilia oligospora]KAF3092186.1 hypothetical protein TWF103_011319 [Orbilia oligospora]KAF3116828.1 hypothetical protein TWF706_000054 [Orbilia oligospora]KAF3142161.1 hypothetical protein TWF594_005527 [Orbilia oligospora]KAF3147802.1 hypothetical protein TWF569_005917 [Orbilia oligospora]
MSVDSASYEGDAEIVIHNGKCHCGLVQIAFEAPPDLIFDECNCSICYKLGLIGVDIPASRLVKFEGKEYLKEYTFNKKIAKHWFCDRCGASPLHVPRSNPNGYSIHLRCLDKSTLRSYKIVPFDGENWESTISREKAARDEALQRISNQQ